MLTSKTEIHDIIVKTIRDELAPCSVGVNVREREDFDDDEMIFDVTISIDSDWPRDYPKMLGLIRKIRLRLSEVDMEKGFPMLSFIAKHEEQISGLEFA